jgi:hypothetical protein
MAEFFKILAQGRQGGEQWVTLLIFIVIVAVNVIGGIIKAANKSNTKRKDEESGIQGRRPYKPAQQWDRHESPAEETQAERPETSPLSNLDAILRARREQLQAEHIRQQRMSQQAQLQEQFDHGQRAQMLEMKRQRLIEQKTLAEQRQKLQQQKDLMLQMTRPAAGPTPRPQEVPHQPSGIYKLAEFSAEQLQDVLVACEVMGKPVSLRENDERLF